MRNFFENLSKQERDVYSILVVVTTIFTTQVVRHFLSDTTPRIIRMTLSFSIVITIVVSTFTIYRYLKKKCKKELSECVDDEFPNAPGEE